VNYSNKKTSKHHQIQRDFGFGHMNVFDLVNTTYIHSFFS